MENVAGRYEIEREIGRGGMGTVLLAKDITLGRKVALKKLTIDSSGTGSEEAARRFMREARLTSQLSHPCIVSLFDVLEVGSELFIVLEYYESVSLATRIEQTGPMSESEVRTLGTQIASALSYAHGEGVVHRDVKPDNILLGAKGAKLTDFGIARLAEGTQDSDTKLTQTGFYVGTPGYMSPEQIQGEQASPRSDVFGVALTLFFALTGEEPFGTGAPAAVLYRIVHEPLDVEQLNVSNDLKVILTMASAKLPENRPTAAELSARLASAGSQLSAPVKGEDHVDDHSSPETASQTPAMITPVYSPAPQPAVVALPTPPPGAPSFAPQPPTPAMQIPSTRSKTGLLIASVAGLIVFALIVTVFLIFMRGARTQARNEYVSQQGFKTVIPAGWNVQYNPVQRTDRFSARNGNALVLVGKIGPARSDINEKDNQALLSEYLTKNFQLDREFTVNDDLITVDSDARYAGNEGVGFRIVVVENKTRARFTGEYFVFNAQDSQWGVLNAAREGSFELHRRAFNEIESSFAAN